MAVCLRNQIVLDMCVCVFVCAHTLRGGLEREELSLALPGQLKQTTTRWQSESERVCV